AVDAPFIVYLLEVGGLNLSDHPEAGDRSAIGENVANPYFVIIRSDIIFALCPDAACVQRDKRQRRRQSDINPCPHFPLLLKRLARSASCRLRNATLHDK